MEQDPGAGRPAGGSASPPTINAWNDLYCLGYGATYPIALEGALKLKEITYAHCEGMLSTEFKHGPLSAVTQGLPDPVRRRAGGCAADRQRHQRGHLPRRARHRHRRRKTPACAPTPAT